MSNTPLTPNTSESTELSPNNQRKPPKTSAERSRAFRERQRGYPLKPRGPPKTSAERARECRARQRVRNAINNPQKDPLAISDDSLLASTSTSSQTFKKVPIGSLKNIKIVSASAVSPYKTYSSDKTAHVEFQKQFLANPFGSICAICDRLCFKNDVAIIDPDLTAILLPEFENTDFSELQACLTCRGSLERGIFPKLSKTNGFSYPKIPENLPKLDILSERLIAAYLPFSQIRRLRHSKDSFDNFAQTINCPITGSTLIDRLPRNVDYCINLNYHETKILETKDLVDSTEKDNMRYWLEYLIETPLYEGNDITINESFFKAYPSIGLREELKSEAIKAKETLTAQQQTLLWSDLNYFQSCPSALNTLHYSLFENYAEELSFPSIYLGTPRLYSRSRYQVTPIMTIMSELRRSDRRGVEPEHLLFMALKLMVLRLRANTSIISRPTTEDHIRGSMSDSVTKFVEDNKRFLKSIPNSVWYWADRAEDLLAMIRQIGRPTMSLSFQANQKGWNHLLQILFKCRHGCDMSQRLVGKLTPLEKNTLINQDAVTCGIYLNALVGTLLNILKSKNTSPFGEHYVIHYYRTIEFPHTGCPRVHLLLWLNNAPNDPIGLHKTEAIRMIDKLVSVSRLDAVRNIELQTHNHGPGCFGEGGAGENCQVGAPFMPCRETVILVPMHKAHPGFHRYSERFRMIKEKLGKTVYPDMKSFYEQNQIISDEHYVDVLRAGISQPTVFLKRGTREIWHRGFNPFVLNVINSSIDAQMILDDQSCANFVARYVGKSRKGRSDLRRKIMEIAADPENPELDIGDINKRIGADLLGTVEMTTFEAAWYLLDQPMCSSSTRIIHIPTERPLDRPAVIKTSDETADGFVVDDSSQLPRDDALAMYIDRPQHLEEITLAQFVSYHFQNWSNENEGSNPCIIRYQNYDRETELDEYKREMVTLHLPFRNEEWEILQDNKYLALFDANEEIILQRRTDFEKDLDVTVKIGDICRELREREEKVKEAEIAAFAFETAWVKTEPMDDN